MTRSLWFLFISQVLRSKQNKFIFPAIFSSIPDKTNVVTLLSLSLSPSYVNVPSSQKKVRDKLPLIF